MIEDLAARLVELLDEHRIPYMLVGSIASSYHGEPRMARDVDVVIDPTPEKLRSLTEALSAAGYDVDADEAAKALDDRSQFRVIDSTTGRKADLTIRKERPFSREEFSRRHRLDSPAGTLCIATAEDTIIAKLERARSGDSEHQLGDIASIVATAGDRLDLSYISRWVDELGLRDLWDKIRA
jgi:hypothetical protein